MPLVLAWRDDPAPHKIADAELTLFGFPPFHAWLHALGGMWSAGFVVLGVGWSSGSVGSSTYSLPLTDEELQAGNLVVIVNPADEGQSEL